MPRPRSHEHERPEAAEPPEPRAGPARIQARTQNAARPKDPAARRAAPPKIREHAPLDKRLHEIADALAAAQRPNFYELAATITHQGHYSHEYGMQIEIDQNGDAGREPTEGSAEAVIEAMHDLARWLYRQLKAEYDNETSNSVVDEAIQANEWPFTANGAFFAV